MNTLDVFEKAAESVFFDEKEKSLYIANTGYNDFRRLAGSSLYRKQAIYTLHYVIAGKGNLFYDGSKYNLKGGDMFILPPNEEICYFPDEKEPWRYVWFDFLGEEAVKHFNKIKEKYAGAVINDLKPEKAVSILGEYFAMFSARKNFGYYKALSVLYALMNEAENSTANICVNRITESAKECAELNYGNPEFNVESLCAFIHTGHSYLCRVFKKETGATVKEYLTDLRLNAAMRLISSSDMKISGIASAVGFADEFNFMKAFKKRFGKPCGFFRGEENKASRKE